VCETRKSKPKVSLRNTFDDFLREGGIYSTVQTTAMKRILTKQLTDAMKEHNLTNIKMARRMRASRAQLVQISDPDNANVTLATLSRAADVVGREFRFELA